MKIGIATYHHVINDGAVLQAYAQQQALQRIMPDARVEVIDFRYALIEKRERFDVIKDVLKFRKSAWAKFKKYRTVRKFVKTQLVMSDRRFVSDDLGEVTDYINSQYRAVVVGSDEVWKIDYKKFSRPFPNLYWLPQPIKVIRIASAATANTLNLKKLKDDDKVKAGKLLQSFRLAGVRDQFTYDFVRREAKDVELQLMPDPTFGLEMKESVYEAARRKLTSAGIDWKKPILGLSLSSNIAELRKLSAGIFSTFSKLGYQVVSIGQYNEYCHFNLTAQLDPLEWAHVYRYFNFCITDRFHSTIFSIRNQVNFVSVDFSNRYQGDTAGKIQDLLTRISMMDHYINLKHIPAGEVMKKIDDIRAKQDVPAVLKTKDQALATAFQTFLESVKTVITQG